MKKKTSISRNALAAVCQILCIGAILFLLYRFLLRNIGVEQLGLWSLVLSVSSVSNIANFGLSGSVVKFVAKYAALERYDMAGDVIQTAVLSVGLLVGLFLLAAYPFCSWLLGKFVEPGSLPLALDVLPFAFTALWIMVLTSIVQAGIDGCQRIDLRSLLLISGSLFHLLLCFVLVPSYGLIGLAWARIVQNSLVLIASWGIVKYCLWPIPILPYKWTLGIFKEIWLYGVNFQIVTFSAMLYDPVTKMLLSRFGGLSLVGYYEMASRMVNHIRSILVAANQVLVPAFAEWHEKRSEKVDPAFRVSYEVMWFLAFPSYTGIILFTPLVSRLWIGSQESDFMLYAVLLSLGWLVNTIASPAYMANLGSAQLRWNVVAHILIAFLNGVAGFLLGSGWGAHGVIIAWVLSLALGSSVIAVSYHFEHGIPFGEWLPPNVVAVVGTCILSMLFYLTALWFLLEKMDVTFYSFSIEWAMPIMFGLIIALMLWLNPNRVRIIMWLGLNAKSR
jgi:O-antigen/teichoic acid export membrane protein